MQTQDFTRFGNLLVSGPKYSNLELFHYLDQDYGLDKPFYKKEWILFSLFSFFFGSPQPIYNNCDSKTINSKWIVENLVPILPKLGYFDTGANFTSTLNEQNVKSKYNTLKISLITIYNKFCKGEMKTKHKNMIKVLLRWFHSSFLGVSVRMVKNLIIALECNLNICTTC